MEAHGLITAEGMVIDQRDERHLALPLLKVLSHARPQKTRLHLSVRPQHEPEPIAKLSKVLLHRMIQLLHGLKQARKWTQAPVTILLDLFAKALTFIPRNIVSPPGMACLGLRPSASWEQCSNSTPRHPFLHVILASTELQVMHCLSRKPEPFMMPLNPIAVH